MLLLRVEWVVERMSLPQLNGSVDALGVSYLALSEVKVDVLIGIWEKMVLEID